MSHDWEEQGLKYWPFPELQAESKGLSLSNLQPVGSTTEGFVRRVGR
jgi:hypothetical protein